MVDLRRSSDWLVKPDNFSLFGIVSLAFLGVAGPLNMAGEISRAGKQAERRIITRHLLWGSLIILVCFIVTTLAVLVVQGPTVLFFDAFTIVHVALGSFVSDIAVICFAASCLAAGYTIIVFLIAPYASIFGGSPTTRLVTLTTINTATMVVIWTVMTLFLFVALFLFLQRNRHNIRQQRLFPMPLLWGSSVVGFTACLGIIGAVLSFSWIPQLIGNGTWFYVVGGLSLTYLAIFAVWSSSHINQSEWEV
jgi:glutamate:GABA antiporter